MRLVYYEEFVYPDAAINREKEIKAWRRAKKIRLVESINPHWNDLAENWTDIYKPDRTRNRYVSSTPRQVPRSAGENAGLRDDAAR